MSNITISSTTDSQEQVEQAIEYDQQIGHDESPTTGRSHVTVTSPTDEPIAVDEANSMYPGQVAARDGRFTQQVAEKSPCNRPQTL